MSHFYRSRTDKKIFGLCGGLAEKFNVDPTLLRFIVVVTAFFSGGTVIAIYFIAGMVIPLEPRHGDMSGGYSWDVQPMYGMKYAAAGCRNHSRRHHSGHRDDADSKYDADFRTPQTQTPSSYTPSNSGKLDEMMKDIEQKALREELAQLRAKLAQYEKGE